MLLYACGVADAEELVAGKYAVMAPVLDERQRRVWLGVEARALGRGGVSAVARATGVSRTTVSKAVRELEEPEADGEEGGRCRWGGHAVPVRAVRG